MHLCCICSTESVRLVLNFGEQPVSNRFLFDKSANEYTYPFKIGFCTVCGLVQMIDAPTSEQLKPPYDWIHYNEPENHLDDLVSAIIDLPEVNQQTQFFGLTHFENSTLDRLKNKGFMHVYQLGSKQQYTQMNTLSAIEIIQDFSTHQEIQRISSINYSPDVVIARDILEHAHDPMQFLMNLKSLIKKNGYLILEVPNYKKNFIRHDFSSLWEEHISYFTSATFSHVLKKSGFSIALLKEYQYDLQDYLVAIAKPENDVKINQVNEHELEYENNMMYRYADAYFELGEHYRQILSEYRRHGKITMFGAGHLATHFINLFKLQDLIDFVIDDHPKKCGMFMPGSQLPIVSSNMLFENNIKLCLLSLSQESERSVTQKNSAFTDNGGIFASIFPTSLISLRPYQKISATSVHK